MKGMEYSRNPTQNQTSFVMASNHQCKPQVEKNLNIPQNITRSSSCQPNQKLQYSSMQYHQMRSDWTEYTNGFVHDHANDDKSNICRKLLSPLSYHAQEQLKNSFSPDLSSQGYSVFLMFLTQVNHLPLSVTQFVNLFH